jgi:enterochelin esterase-like enzyme
MVRRILGALAGLALAVTAASAAAQPAPGPGPAGPRPPSPWDTAAESLKRAEAAGVVVQHVKVHGRTLEGNLEGNAVDRDVIVVLPPGYARSKARRYPVLYFLHGFALTAQRFSDFMHAPEAVATAASHGQDFILVMPDTDTTMGGSMYSRSPTVGDFESFVAKDLVAYVDSHYRTLARRSSRGLVGHSMGGYGVWKIGMDFPRPWGAIYAMSACCVSPRVETVDQAKKISEIPFDQVAEAGFGEKAALASAAAWSPDPKNPPYYFDFAYKDGAIDPLVIAKWAVNSPLAMVPQHVGDLKSYIAVGADVGDKDGLLGDDTAIHDELELFGVSHRWEVYPGNHVSGITARFPTVILPFFAQHLQMK